VPLEGDARRRLLASRRCGRQDRARESPALDVRCLILDSPRKSAGFDRIAAEGSHHELNRRDFARASALTALSIPRPRRNDRVALGVVGTGGADYVMSCFRMNPRSRWALCDVYAVKVTGTAESPRRADVLRPSAAARAQTTRRRARRHPDHCTKGRRRRAERRQGRLLRETLVSRREDVRDRARRAREPAHLPGRYAAALRHGVSRSARQVRLERAAGKLTHVWCV